MKIRVTIDVPDSDPGAPDGIEAEVNNALTWQPWECTWTVERTEK